MSSDSFKRNNIQREFDGFFSEHKDLLSTYKNKNLYEEFMQIFIDIFDDLINKYVIHSTEILEFLLSENKMPQATKKDFERLRNEIHKIIREYKFKTIKKDIEDCLDINEKDLLSEYKKNNLFEEFIWLIVDMEEDIFSVHRSDVYNFLMYLVGSNLLPQATKQDLEKFEKEKNINLKGYRKYVDSISEEKYGY